MATDPGDLPYPPDRTASTSMTWFEALRSYATEIYNEAVLLAGRITGQVINGGTGASENLTLHSTAHATKGDIEFGTEGSKYDEANDVMILLALQLLGDVAEDKIMTSDATGVARWEDYFWNWVVSQAIAGGSDTTVSATYEVMDLGPIGPLSAGYHKIDASGVINVDEPATVSVALFSDGDMVAGSERVLTMDGNTSVNFHTMGSVLSTGVESYSIQWKTSAGEASSPASRYMFSLKYANPNPGE